MATHVIKNVDRRHDHEQRTILWDDETGEVSGDHSDVPAIRAALERGELRDVFGRCVLRDPRGSADFVAALYHASATAFDLVLPPALRGVEPTPWEISTLPGEVA